MHRLSLLLGLLASVNFSFAAVTILSAPLYKYNGPVAPDSYIVKLRNGVDLLSFITDLLEGVTAGITKQWDPDFFNGFAGNFDAKVINTLQSSPNVEYVAENGIMSAFVTQTDAPWGLARVSSRTRLSNQNPINLNYTYEYDSPAGNGVDIYVLDTGIDIQHPDLSGRATWGATFCSDTTGCGDADGNGHGTHVSGTAGGTRFGVAKEANLIAVKVLSDAGSGTVTDIMNGLEWVLTQYQFTGRPSIATMSLGGSYSLALNEAVEKLILNGIHCTVAAGNSNQDASVTSPASTPDAITVGATNIGDSRASYSNYGTFVDVFAPGSNITSAWPGGRINTISGTSMVVLPMSQALMSNCIKSLAHKGVLSDVPLLPLTLNLLAYNNYQS